MRTRACGKRRSQSPAPLPCGPAMSAPRPHPWPQGVSGRAVQTLGAPPTARACCLYPAWPYLPPPDGSFGTGHRLTHQADRLPAGPQGKVRAAPGSSQAPATSPMSPPQYPFPQGPVTHRPLSAGRAGTGLSPLGESEATRRRAPSPGPGSGFARGIDPAPQRGCSRSYTRALRKGAKGCGLSAERGEGLGRACHPESPQTILSSRGRDTGGAPLAWQRLERVSGFTKPIDRGTGLPGTAYAAAVQTPPHSLAAATQQHWWGAPWDLLWAQSGLAA